MLLISLESNLYSYTHPYFRTLTLRFGAFLVQLDYVEGRRLSRAYLKNKQSGLIEEAEDISEAAQTLSKAEDEELEREVRKSEASLTS